MASYGVSITLPLPVAGNVQWDGPLNSILQAIIDVLATRVTVDGLDVQAALDMQGNALVDATNIQFVTNGDPGVANSIYYSSGGELFVRDGLNRQIQLTAGGIVNVAGSGGFGGDYSSSNQNGASYTNATNTFTFTFGGGTSYANVEHADLKLHNGSSANSVTVKAPTSLASSYNLTLPQAPSAGNPNMMVVDATGTISFRQLLPAGQQALVAVDATGSINYRLSSSFVDYVDPSTGNPEDGAILGLTGWSLNSSNTAVQIPIPYRTGDRIDGLDIGMNFAGGASVTCSIFHRSFGSQQAQLARVAFNGSSSGAIFRMTSGTPTMTGTLPITPPGTGSLVLRVQTVNSIVLGPVAVSGTRKLIT